MCTELWVKGTQMTGQPVRILQGREEGVDPQPMRGSQEPVPHIIQNFGLEGLEGQEGQVIGKYGAR